MAQLNYEAMHFTPFDYEKLPEKKGSHKGAVLGILTSGGDSQGMNAAIRGITRMGLYLGARVYFIKEGYQGMIDGGDNIIEAKWEDVEGIIHKGGTIIGSARCPGFKTPEGRKKAALNLINKKIMNLVVIGGDGSLTGAYEFRRQWTTIVDSLAADGAIEKDKTSEFSFINVVGIVGSIDNDFCGTDMTIGTDSALHRIMEAVDAIFTTASSHKRAFILEVMGRNCGYLAIIAALTSEANYVFIPERPPGKDWPEVLSEKLKKTREFSEQRLNIIILAEGSVDIDLNPISVKAVEKVVVESLGYDTRVTVLGHIQRGGNASAFDRILGSRMGAEAAHALLTMEHDSVPVVISLIGNHVNRVPLMECVEKTRSISKALKEKRWDDAVEMRGSCFQRNLMMCEWLLNLAPQETSEFKDFFTVGVLHVGAPCCGMNAVVWSFVRACSGQGLSVLGIKDGFDGLSKGRVMEMSYSNVSGWVSQGGTILGVKSTLPENLLSEIVQQLRNYSIKGLLMIGDFQAYKALLQLVNHRNTYPELCIPMAVVPATINNNIPGSDLTIGSDTALNELTRTCDKLCTSARSTKDKAIIAQVMGGYCGYLTTMAGLASEADITYVFEEKFTTRQLLSDASQLRLKMISGLPGGLILRSEKANEYLTIETMSNIFAGEGEDIFFVLNDILGLSHQGDNPSPFDRDFGIKMGLRASKWIIDMLKTPEGEPVDSKDTAVVLGVMKSTDIISPVQTLIGETDFN